MILPVNCLYSSEVNLKIIVTKIVNYLKDIKGSLFYTVTTMTFHVFRAIGEEIEESGTSASNSMGTSNTSHYVWTQASIKACKMKFKSSEP